MYTWWFWQAWNFKLQNVVPMEYSVKNTVYMVYIYIYIYIKIKISKKEFMCNLELGKIWFFHQLVLVHVMCPFAY